MSKSVYYEVQFVSLHQKKPVPDLSPLGGRPYLSIGSFETTESKYRAEVGWGDPDDPKAIFDTDYSEWQIGTVTELTPRDTNEEGLYQVEAANGAMETRHYRKWWTTSVPDTFVIPEEHDRAGLQGPHRFLDKDKTSFGFSDLKYDFMNQTFVEFNHGSLKLSTKDSISAALENIGKAAGKAVGLDALVTQYENAKTIRSALEGQLDKALDVVKLGFDNIANPNFQPGAYDAAEKELMTGMQDTFRKTLTDITMFPGNEGAEKAADAVLGNMRVAGNAVRNNALPLEAGAQVGIQISFGDVFKFESTFTGTVSADIVLDGASGSRIETLDGDDAVMGGGGSDHILGGPGKDYLHGGGDNDVVEGDAGLDTLRGGGGDDRLIGGADFDRIDGGEGTDTAVWSAVRRSSSTGLGISEGERQVFAGQDGDILTNVERLAFTDGEIQMDVMGPAARVYRLYDATLDRTPEAGGLRAWTEALQGGVPVNGVAKGFTDLPEFVQKYGNLDDAEFVTLMYRNVLNREPDPDGLDHWVRQIGSGMTRQDVVLGFSDSTENVERLRPAVQQGLWVTDREAASAARLYDTVLDRLPDGPGLGAWRGALEGGAALTDVAKGFMESPEFKQKYGDLDDAAFVRQLYRNVLGREGEESGVEAWKGALAGGQGRWDVVVGFSESPEHIGQMAPFIDDGVWVI